MTCSVKISTAYPALVLYNKAMQVLASHFINRWVIDRSRALATAQVSRLFLDPKNLKVAYFEVESITHEDHVFVRSDQIVIEGEVLTVASANSLGEKDDFIRDQDILSSPCLLTGYKVIDRSKRRLGRITDYTISTTTMRAERLHIGVPFWQRLLMPERVMSARSIHEVLPDKKQVIVNQSVAPAKTRSAEPVAA